MKDYRFYLEYPTKADKRKATRANLGNHSGNCIAVYLPSMIEQYRANKCYEAAGAVYYRSDSPCAFTQVSPEFLSERCKRVSFETAKSIHPELISYLNQG